MADAGVREREQQAIGEINEILKRYNLALVPFLETSRDGIVPRIGLRDITPKPGPVETAPQAQQPSAESHDKVVN